MPLGSLTTLAAKPEEAGTEMREAGRAVEEKRGKPGGFTETEDGRSRGWEQRETERKEGRSLWYLSCSRFSAPLPTATLKVSLSHPFCGWGHDLPGISLAGFHRFFLLNHPGASWALGDRERAPEDRGGHSRDRGPAGKWARPLG